MFKVYYEIYPVWIYSYLSVLVVVFLVTDFLRYKVVIIFEAISYISTWCLLLWARGVPWMQFMEFCYGINSSTEVAYYTYIYTQVSGDHYQQVASYTRTALLCGRASAGAFGQFVIHGCYFGLLSFVFFVLFAYRMGAQPFSSS